MDDLYRSLFDGSPDAQIVVDSNGIIQHANARVEEIFGYTASDLIGSEIEVLIPSRLREIHREHRGTSFDALAVGSARPLVSGLRYDGSEVSLGVNLATIPTSDGDLTLATIRDIDGWTEAFDAHAAFDGAPIPMALAVVTDDGDRVIRTANCALAELLGRRQDALSGISLHDLTHSDDHSISEKAATAIVTGVHRSFEGRKRYRHTDGHVIWVDVHARLVESPGADRTVLVHVLDVGDRVALEQQQRTAADALEAEVALRTAAHAESERRLRLSLDAERHLLIESQEQQQRLDVSVRAAGLGTFEWDVDRNEVTSDERAASIVGLPAEPMPAERFLEVIDLPHRERIIAAVRSALDRREPYDAVFRIGATSRRDRLRWIHGWGQPVEDENGSVRKIVGVLQDVTAELEARRLIEERDQRLQLVLDVTVTGVFDWDVRDQTITFSDNWYASVGFDPGDLDTRQWDWRRIVHPDDWQHVSHLIDGLIAGSVPTFTCDARLRRADDTWRWSRLAAQGVEHDKQGRPSRVIGADTDISGQRLLEQQLVHSATMQSLGEFAGGIAHDFNNVMAIVRGHTEFLLRRDSDEADTERRLTSIERAVERASSLVRELMLLGRPATDNPVVVDLVDHIRTVSASWPSLLGDDIALEVELPAEPVPVRIDRGRLDAMLLNLASNSHDAMPDGGTLRIVVRCRDRSGGDEAEILISDDGIGMDESTMGPLFEPFFTTKAPGVGTGLGMATSYTTVTQAGGTISAHSRLGSGTTIRVVFPLATTGTVAAVVPTQAVDRSGMGRRGSILVVEDEAEILQLSADVLRLAGHRVYEALNGNEALEILHGGAAVDVLLTDVVMPEMSGPLLAAEVCEHWPRIRVLYLSGHAASTHATETIDPTRLLTKPISSDDLVNAISELLGEDR